MPKNNEVIIVMTWLGIQTDAFISTLSKNIGIYIIVFFLLCIIVSALFSLKKRVMQNVAALVMVLVSAQTSFLLVGSLYDILIKRQSVQDAVAELLGMFPELGASVESGVALSKYLVSLVAVPALFMLLYGILSLAFYIVMRYGVKAARKGTSKEEVGSNITAALKIASGVISAIAAMIAFFSPSNTLLDLMTLPPIILAAFATVRGVLSLFGKLHMESSPLRKVISLLVGAATGAVTFVMIFFPFLAVADLAVIGVDAIPEEAWACYEMVSTDGAGEDAAHGDTADAAGETTDVIGSVFRYSAEAKGYLNSYENTFLSAIYPKFVFGMHCNIAPVGEMRSVVRTTVVLGSYYYCEKNDVAFANARERLSDEIAALSGNSECNDILQSLFCTAAADALVTRQAGGETEDAALQALRDTLYSTARLGSLEELESGAMTEENGHLADVYMALCKLIALQGKQTSESVWTEEELVCFGALLDAMHGSYSFAETVEPILDRLILDETVGPYIDREEVAQNVAWGEYGYATYMEIVWGRMTHAA